LMIPIGKWKNGPVNTRPGATLSSMVTHTRMMELQEHRQYRLQQYGRASWNYLDEWKLKFKTASIFIPLKKSWRPAYTSRVVISRLLKKDNHKNKTTL
jgi:hypothetical protein